MLRLWPMLVAALWQCSYSMRNHPTAATRMRPFKAIAVSSSAVIEAAHGGSASGNAGAGALFGMETFESTEPVLTPRIIWTFWDKGEANLPNFLHICLESWRLNCPGWNVIVLSPSNILEYLELGNDLPSTFFDIDRASLQSDVARIAVLARFGGIYTDISTLSMSNVAEEVYATLQGGASVYAYHNFGWLHDFVAAWFVACKPREPVMVEWSRTLNHLLEGRVSDEDIHQHPSLAGVDLADYHGPRPVGPNHPSKCWADYLIVNVALRAVLHRHPRLAERFWRTACLIDQGHQNRLSPTRMFDHAAQVGLHVDQALLGRLTWPDGPMHVSKQLLCEQDAAVMRTLASAPFVKFFQAGKVCSALEGAGLDGLQRSSGIAQLIDYAFKLPPPPPPLPLPREHGSRARTLWAARHSPASIGILLSRLMPRAGSLLAHPFSAVRQRPANRLRLWITSVGRVLLHALRKRTPTRHLNGFVDPSLTGDADLWTTPSQRRRLPVVFPPEVGIATWS